jgi:hypothetical protein
LQAYLLVVILKILLRIGIRSADLDNDACKGYNRCLVKIYAQFVIV